jgi:hypothetical protein
MPDQIVSTGGSIKKTLGKSVFGLAALFVLLAVSLQSGPARPATDPLKQLDAYILKAMKDWDLPGLAVERPEGHGPPEKRSVILLSFYSAGWARIPFMGQGVATESE